MRTKITLFFFLLLSISAFSQEFGSFKKFLSREKSSKISDSDFSIQQKLKDLKVENNLSINIDAKLRLDSIKHEIFFPDYGLAGSAGGFFYSYMEDAIIETSKELILPYDRDGDDSEIVPLSEYQIVTTSRNEYLYDQNYRIIQINIFEYEYEEGDPLFLSYSVLFERDRNGNILEKKESYRDDPQEEFIVDSESYEYDSSGNLIGLLADNGVRIEIEYWDVDVDCRCEGIRQTISYFRDGSYNEKITYGTNQIGELGQVVDFQKIEYYWDGTEWQMRFKFEEIWDDIKGIEKVVSRLKSVRGISEWYKEYEDEYIYDDDGVMKEKNIFWWDPFSRHIIGKEIYKKEENRKYSFIKTERNFLIIDNEPPLFEEWKNKEKIEYTFNNDDFLVEKKYFAWNVEINEWLLNYEEIYSGSKSYTFDSEFQYKNVLHIFPYSQIQAETFLYAIMYGQGSDFKPIDLGRYETPKPLGFEEGRSFTTNRSFWSEGNIDDNNILRSMEFEEGIFKFYYSKTLSAYPEFTSIPDVNFEKYLIDVGIDSNQFTDGVVKTSVIFKEKQIDVSRRNIKSLEGIEAFQSLDSLISIDNQIASLDLSENKQLKHIDLSGNKLSDLNVSNNINLKSLKIENDTLLTNLKLYNDYNFNIENIELKNTGLESLDVLNLPNLKRLIVKESELREVNLTQNFKLKELDLSNNSLSGNVPDYLVDFPELKHIDISYNQFEEMLPNFTKLSELSFLNVSYNRFLSDDLLGNFEEFKNLLLTPWSESIWYSPQIHPLSDTISDIYSVGSTIELNLRNDTNSGGSKKRSVNKLTISSDTYQWFKDNQPIPGANMDTFTILDSKISDGGIYHCEVYNLDMPELIVISMPYTITISSALGIDEDESVKNSIVVYPNPAQEYIHIQQNDELNFEEVQIYDINGKKVKFIQNRLDRISLEGLKDGIYYLKIRTEKGQSSKKLVIGN